MRVLIAVLVACAALSFVAPIASAEPAKVVVSLFSEANDQQQPDWITRAIQQSVADDLAALKSVQVVSNTPAGDGKVPDAQFRITGTIQRVDGELRVTGRVEDIATGKIVGGFKATGGQQDLFTIEDAISKQLKAVLAPDEKPQPVNPAAVAGAQAPAGKFDGSELQRALEERDYLIRAANRNLALLQAAQYQQPLYPNLVGLNGNSWPNNNWGWNSGWGGGWGWGGGGGGVIIINQSSGGRFCPPTSGGSWGGSGSGSWSGGRPGGSWNNGGGRPGGSWNAGGGSRPNGSWGGGRSSGAWAGSPTINPSMGLTHTMTRVPSLVMGK